VKNSTKTCYLLLPQQYGSNLFSVFDSKDEAEKAKTILIECAKIPCSILEIQCLETAEEHKVILLEEIKKDFLKRFEKGVDT
jgi:hypothetical protein